METIRIRTSRGIGGWISRAAGILAVAAWILVVPPGGQAGTLSEPTDGGDDGMLGRNVSDGSRRASPIPKWTEITLGPTLDTAGWPISIVTNSLPFASSFEGNPLGPLQSGVSGWMTYPEDLSSVVEHSYEPFVGYPLSEAQHSQILSLNAEGQRVFTLFGANVRCTTTYVDMMVSFVRAEDLPQLADPPPLITLVASYFYGTLQVHAAWLDTGGTLVPEWFSLTPSRLIQPRELKEFRRLTLHVVRDGDGEHDFVQVLLDGEALAHPKGRVAPAVPSTGGTWFCLTRDVEQPVPSLSFRGMGLIDDVHVYAPPRTVWPELELVGVGASEVGLRWTSEPGFTYALQERQSLAQGSWETLAVTTADDHECDATVQVEGRPHAFFRVVAPE